jgi:hypothetical protein
MFLPMPCDSLLAASPGHRPDSAVVGVTIERVSWTWLKQRTAKCQCSTFNVQ